MPLRYESVILQARLLVAVEADERLQAKIGSHVSMTLRISREVERLSSS